ncbi:MAG: glycosyltransferase [Flavobacteriaceae bacterium]|nr:glycosyltransferase [Flavobacteriaceae bacterium]
MKVLILTYYWPPAGGSGVQRWLKFVKYLPEFKITPIVFTVDNANYPKIDNSLINDISDEIEVLKTPIKDLSNYFFWKKMKSNNSGVSNATNNKILSFIRGNFFIPDPKILWKKDALKAIKAYLKENSVDVIISTGPPHSVHLIAKEIQKSYQIPWIADFRDPWSNLYYQNEFKQLRFAKNKNRQLEKSVLKSADCILTVSNSLQKEFSKVAKRVEVITNGFDDEVLNSSEISLDKKFSISYIGLLPKQSNPKNLFKVLQTLIKKVDGFKQDLQLNFVGDISDEIKNDIQGLGLIDNSKFHGYVSHKEAINFQKSSQVLLLLIPNVENSQGILTGKLFEYLTSIRPILALSSSKGDLAEILNETKAGKLFSYKDTEDLEQEILSLYELYKKGALGIRSKNIEKFHRKNLTKDLSELIKSLT